VCDSTVEGILTDVAAANVLQLIAGILDFHHKV
jgi:hypothetical protein